MKEEISIGEHADLNGTPKEKKYFIMDECLPFSQSSLWDSVRKFYSDQGPAAWQEGLVPSHITSNCFIANSYASLLLGFMHDSRGENTDINEPVYIFEMGAGHGKFGYLVLKKMLEQQSESPELYGNLKFVYIMTDFAFANIKFWQAHPKLREFVSMGILDFALFDCEHDTEISLLYSQKHITVGSLKNNIAVIANYIFDSLRCDHFRIREGRLEEGLITVVVPNEAAEQHLKDDIAKETAATDTEMRVAEADPMEMQQGTFDTDNQHYGKTPDAEEGTAGTELVSDMEAASLPLEEALKPIIDARIGKAELLPADITPVTNWMDTGQGEPLEPIDMPIPIPVGLEDCDVYVSVDDGTTEEPKKKIFHRMTDAERLALLSTINPERLLHWFDYIPFDLEKPLYDNMENMDQILKLYVVQELEAVRIKDGRNIGDLSPRKVFPEAQQMEHEYVSSDEEQSGCHSGGRAWQGRVATSPSTARNNRRYRSMAEKDARFEEEDKVDQESHEENQTKKNKHNTSFLYPSGTLICMERLRNWSTGASMFITADKGYVTRCGPSGLREPHLAMHGCISTMVNFHACGHYVECNGGFQLFSELQDSSIKISAYVMPAAGTPLAVPPYQPGTSPIILPSPMRPAFSLLQRNFNSMINNFGPYDFFSLEVCLARELKNVSANLALRLLRLSRYDPDVYYRFADAFLDEEVMEDCDLQGDVRRAIGRTWENFYLLEKDHDVAFQIARFYFVIEDYETALVYFDFSIKLMGDSYCTIFDKGLCYYYSYNFVDAKEMFEKAGLANPSILGKSLEWIQRCAAAEELLANQQTVNLADITVSHVNAIMIENKEEKK